ncbi:PucR family transcriptional regulator [Streptomyces hygroscopicus]|uniref:PucR family transcriptional regulator n=1 Tax=Streptomyces hygroscopicus TaxID=1912 RepID=UPI0006906888|nr:helix-turn-helix domain-containing protein [Streptomyces hygroscopicus]
MSADGIRARERAWLARLRPEDEAVIGSAVSDPMLVAEVVARVGRAAAGWAIEAGQAMAARRNVHGLSDVRYVHFRPRRSYEALALSAVVSLSGDHTPPAALRSEVSALVREAVPRGVSVDVGLQGVQLFHSDFLGRLFDWCGAHLPAESQAEVMRQMSADLFEGMAALSALMAQEFAVTRDRWLAGAAAARQEMVRDILAGREIGRDAAMSRLSYDLTVHHLALIAWSDTEVDGGADELADAATRLLTAAGCSSVLLVPTGTAKLWAWGGRVSGPPTPGPDRQSAPRNQGLPPHLRVALGRPGYALAGFRRSHEQALAAERAGRVGRSPGPVYDYERLELPILLNADPVAAAEFVTRVLGPLAADDPAMAELRSTLSAYLDDDRAVSAVAERLHIAKNTVLYRVKKAEQLRGRPVKEDRLAVHAALNFVEVFGPPSQRAD